MGGRLSRKRPGCFSISVFGRFAYTLSALNGHYLGGFFRGFWFLGNVRSYQTACARTAGHWDIGKVCRLILLWVGRGGIEVWTLLKASFCRITHKGFFPYIFAYKALSNHQWPLQRQRYKSQVSTHSLFKHHQFYIFYDYMQLTTPKLISVNAIMVHGFALCIFFTCRLHRP